MNNAIEIFEKVISDGFCVFPASKILRDAVSKSALINLPDGFHVDVPDHLELMKGDQILMGLGKIIEAEASKRNYSHNQVHLVRVVDPGSGERYRTHYDSHLYTIVIPLTLPASDNENRGQLYMIPAMRNRPKNDIMNLFSKVYGLRYRGESGHARLVKDRRYMEVNLKPGEILMFEGMVCLHGNKANESESKRITLLAHYVDPFPRGVGSIMRRLRLIFRVRRKG